MMFSSTNFAWLRCKTIFQYQFRFSIFPVAGNISRRKHNKPKISASIDEMKSNEMSFGGFMRVSGSAKRLALQQVE